jgi:hypothetical protein
MLLRDEVDWDTAPRDEDVTAKKSDAELTMLAARIKALIVG